MPKNHALKLSRYDCNGILVRAYKYKRVRIVSKKPKHL